jgi:hypothetical protein
MRIRLAALVLSIASLVLAMAAAVFALDYPLYSGFDGTRPTRATLVEVNGGWVAIPVLFPVAIALLPVVFRQRWVRIAAAVVLWVFAFLAGMSIGLFYVPAAVAMLVAAMVGPGIATSGG